MSYVERLESERKRAAELAEAHSIYYLEYHKALTEVEKKDILTGVGFYNHMVQVYDQQISWMKRLNNPWTWPKEPAWTN